MYREKRTAELMGVGRDDLIEYVLRLEYMVGGPLDVPLKIYIEIKAEEFHSVCKHQGNPALHSEREYYKFGNTYGVVVFDIIDNDWSYVVIGFQDNEYRAVDLGTSINSVQLAREELFSKMKSNEFGVKNMYREKRIAELMGVGRDDLIEYVLRLERKIGGPLLANDEMRYSSNTVHSLDCLNSESSKCIPECPKYK